MSRTKTALVVCSIVEKIQLICGIFLLVFFGLMIVACLFDKELAGDGFLPFCIVVTGIGAFLIFLSRRRNKLIHTFKKYVPSLAGNPTGSISLLAASMGTTEDVVLKNLDQMIRKKLFTYAYIDRQQNRLVFRNQEQNPAVGAAGMSGLASINGVPVTASPAPPELMTVTCEGCGGVNTVAKGQVTECEYCGSKLKGAAS